MKKENKQSEYAPGNLASKTLSDFQRAVIPYQKELLILFVDMVDSTPYKKNHSIVSWMHKTRQHNDNARDIVEKHGGKFVKNIGDEIMAVFPKDQSHKAVNAAIEIQECFLKLRGGNPVKDLDDAEKIFSKIGISAGTVYELYKFDWYGSPVDMAARLVSIAKKSQILVDEKVITWIAPANLTSWWTTYRNIDPTNLICEPVLRKVKGVDNKVKICEIKWSDISIGITDEQKLALEWKEMHQRLEDYSSTFSSTRKTILQYITKKNSNVAHRHWEREKTDGRLSAVTGYLPTTDELQHVILATEQMDKINEAYNEIENLLSNDPTKDAIDEAFKYFDEKLKDYMVYADKAIKLHLSKNFA